MWTYIWKLRVFINLFARTEVRVPCLEVCQLVPLRIDVETYSVGCSREGHSSDEQDEQDDEGEGCREVDHFSNGPDTVHDAQEHCHPGNGVTQQ